jgi:hypothetical protein
MIAITTRLSCGSRRLHSLLETCPVSRRPTSSSHGLRRLSTRALFCMRLKGRNNGHRNITSNGRPNVDIRYSAISLRLYSTETPPPTRRENIYTIPNFLTVSRILACPVLGWSVVQGDFGLATGILAYASITDLVGSYISPLLSTDLW